VRAGMINQMWGMVKGMLDKNARDRTQLFTKSDTAKARRSPRHRPRPGCRRACPARFTSCSPCMHALSPSVPFQLTVECAG